MQTEITIEVPKGFYENKSSVTPDEFLEMATDFVAKVKRMEEDFNHELVNDFKAIYENAKLKERIKQLEEQLKNKGE